MQAYVTVGPFLTTLDRISPATLVPDSLREGDINVENKNVRMWCTVAQRIGPRYIELLPHTLKIESPPMRLQSTRRAAALLVRRRAATFLKGETTPDVNLNKPHQ